MTPKYDDPEKPDFAAAWILIGSRVLAPAGFKVWMRIYPLDKSESGCTASAVHASSTLRR